MKQLIKYLSNYYDRLFDTKDNTSLHYYLGGLPYQLIPLFVVVILLFWGLISLLRWYHMSGF